MAGINKITKVRTKPCARFTARLKPLLPFYLLRQRAVLLLLLCAANFAAPAFAESESGSPEITPHINPAADIFYTLLNINTSNLFLNFGARLGSAGFANTTFETIAHNIYPATWFWEDGDRFLINQFGHPYQGSTYFASARINGFDFYQALPFVLLGSLQWEIMYEPESSINDVITTTIGGIALGEMLHRLFLEVDVSPSVAAKIGGFFVSPLESFNAIYNRPKRQNGGANIYALSVKAGVEKSFAHFTGHHSESASWNNPGAYAGVTVIYGNPFVQESRTPYDHFELQADLISNIASYQMQILSDGYIFSFAFSRARQNTSTGLTIHYDFFNATNDIIDNTGYGNIQFSSTAINWTIKHAIIFSEQAYLSVKAHAGLALWGTSMYNAPIFSDTYLGNTYTTYGAGENIKLFFTASHKKAGALELAAAGYHIFNIPVSPAHSTGTVFFLNCAIAYDFPLSARIGIGAALRYWNLFGQYDAAENVQRAMLSTSVHTSFKF